MVEITRILAEIRRAADPVQVARDLVLADGGAWLAPENHRGLFEIQLAGLVGIGPSARAAVEDWIAQAMATRSSA